MSEPFTCPNCGRTSYNPNDVAFGYCGACHAFTAAPCPMCNDPILPEEYAMPMNGLERGIHRECGLRSAVGSIEHLEMGPHPIGACHEHDRGLTYRENAKLVDEWVAKHGVAAAVSISYERQESD